MSTLSPIQLLPRHFVQLVVKHIASSNLPLFDGVPEGEALPMELLQPFLRYVKRVLDALDHAEVRANITVFVWRVKQMAPKVKSVCLVLAMERVEPPRIAKKYFGSLATQLYQLGDRVKLRSHCSLACMELQLYEIRDLVHIKIGDYDEAVGYLARLNASTLQSLNTRLYRVKDFAVIVVDDGCDYVYIPEDKLLPTFPGAVPFPKLCRITLGGQYPLDDDTIFRGNAATLEYLSLTISPQQLVLFREEGVFTPTSHPNLRYVRIVQPYDVAPDDVDILVVNKDFVLGIGPNALMRE
ncbi:hypothetical protein GGI19_005388, partial [Coemansia pectinata]